MAIQLYTEWVHTGPGRSMHNESHHTDDESETPPAVGTPDDLPSGVTLDPEAADIAPQLRLRNELSESLTDSEFGDAVILPLEAAQELTKDHLHEIITHLRTHEVQSVSQLADDLDVNRGNMSRYLETLLEYDVIDLTQSGKAKRPQLKYDHILFEPLY
ncbi:hypothetical protein SAMN05216388_10125 [Halorientalis persicus]|uniref:Uncharacterized protein n=2 Tax=Halorientalis persicus TaxID=1367881 RepID=A0A1H8PD67_9EURY|nr:hypothetical protein SAMN05216388_10125 [Halorientalis persicus]